MTLPRALTPALPLTPPATPLPNGACDAHIHIVGSDFPLWEGRVEDPAPGTLDEWLTRLRAQMDTLGFARTVFVHSILYGSDNAVTLAATRALGPAQARAIVLVHDTVTDAELDTLAAAGAAGVRLNYVHGGILSWEGARAMAPRLAARGLHIQMLLHSHLHLAELEADIRALPVPLVIDHLGWPDLSLGQSDPGFQCLLRLLSEGRVYVKLSALYRLGQMDVANDFAHSALSANPDHCLWGTDWPHLMLGTAAQPNSGALLNHFLDLASSEEIQKTLVDTPTRLFNFPTP